MTQDVYRGQIDVPGTLHRYGYVGANPARNIDTYGFIWGWVAGGVIAVVIVGVLVWKYNSEQQQIKDNEQLPTPTPTLTPTHSPTNTPTPTINPNGTVSSVSWGETSSIYPQEANIYKPFLWDGNKTAQLLKVRAAIHIVSQRNSNVRKALPEDTPINNIVKPYHMIENFLPADNEILGDKSVKYFYLSSNPSLKQHPGVSKTKLVSW